MAGDYLAVLFDADLSELIPERAILWFVVNPEAPPAFLTTTANPNRWAAAFSYDAATQDPAGFTPERLTAMVHTLLGRADIPLDIVDVTPWQQFIGVAERFRQGRVFLAGDSAHVWPPAGAYGANTGVQDSHNLAWKLAAVLKGWASPALLDSYEPERRPLAQAFMDITVARQAHRTSSNPEQEVKDDLRWMFGQRYTSPPSWAGPSTPPSPTTTCPRPPPATAPRTCGWTATAPASPCTTSPAPASPSSPAPTARHGRKPPRKSPRNSTSRSPHTASAPTCSTRKTSGQPATPSPKARSCSAQTATSPGAPKPAPTPTSSSTTPCAACCTPDRHTGTNAPRATAPPRARCAAPNAPPPLPARPQRPRSDQDHADQIVTSPEPRPTTRNPLTRHPPPPRPGPASSASPDTGPACPWAAVKAGTGTNAANPSSALNVTGAALAAPESCQECSVRRNANES